MESGEFRVCKLKVRLNGDGYRKQYYGYPARI